MGGIRFPLTIRHYADFGEFGLKGSLRQAVTWDEVRAKVPGFTSAATADELKSEVDRRPEIVSRSAAIRSLVSDLGVQRVCSYGVGTGLLECRLLHDLPGVALTCTDFAGTTVDNLRVTLPGAEIVQHDLRAGPVEGFDLHLLHRVDIELSNREWRIFFSRLTEPWLFVVSEILTASSISVELRRRLRGGTFAGWLRSEPALRRLIPSDAVAVDVGDLRGFLRAEAMLRA